MSADISVDCQGTYRPTISGQSTDYWSIVDRYLIDTRPILDGYLTDTWPILGRYLTDTWAILERYLTDTSPAVYCYISADASAVSRLIYRSTTDQLLTDYRRTINRLSVDNRPKVDRYISWLSADMSTKAAIIHLFLCNNEELQMGYLGVMHNWIYVHNFCWNSYDLAFPFLTPRSKRRKSCSSKTSGFFSNKLSLDQGISSCFSSLILSCQRATAGWKQFTSPLTMTSLFWGGIFSDIVISSFDMLTSMKTGFAYSSTTEKTPMSYFVVICGWFCNIQDHYVLVISQWTDLIQERSLYV